MKSINNNKITPLKTNQNDKVVIDAECILLMLEVVKQRAVSLCFKSKGTRFMTGVDVVNSSSFNTYLQQPHQPYTKLKPYLS